MRTLFFIAFWITKAFHSTTVFVSFSRRHSTNNRCDSLCKCTAMDRWFFVFDHLLGLNSFVKFLFRKFSNCFVKLLFWKFSHSFVKFSFWKFSYSFVKFLFWKFSYCFVKFFKFLNETIQSKTYQIPGVFLLSIHHLFAQNIPISLLFLHNE
jgi:hypothetical protein